jgi:hypothetical protein
MKLLHDFLNRLAAALRGRYVRGLEEEASRLRAENRALLNSLLGTAGIPPLDPDRATGPMVASVRRRSWPQIAADREFAAGQKQFNGAPRTGFVAQPGSQG